MRYQSMIRCLELSTCVFLMAGGVASAVVVPVDMSLTSPGGGYNRLSLTISGSVVTDNNGVPTTIPFSDTQTGDASGNLQIKLDATFDSSTHAAAVTGIRFVEETPGSISLGPMHFSFLGGAATIDAANLKATAATFNPPGSVTGISFPLGKHEFALNGGTIGTVDLGATPMRSGPLTGSGTVTVSAPSISGDGKKATYDVDLELPVSFGGNVFTEPPPPEDPTFVVDGAVEATFHATGSFTQDIPEPGAFAMLLGLGDSGRILLVEATRG